jgi:proteasome lid subunit RPN8/RPN11
VTEPTSEGPRPWIAGGLELDRPVLEAVEAHAREAYPSEACGFLLGPAARPALVDEARREPNEADKYHRLDPATFPRTSHTYFKINELRAARTFDEGERGGRPVKVIYHSHCDAGAYFSEEDAATFAAEGTLMWPCAFLVVSVYEGEVRDRRLWAFDAGSGTFYEAPFEVQG